MNKPVYCITTHRKFESAAEAAREYGISSLDISRVCNLNGGTASGLLFRFVYGYDHTIDSEWAYEQEQKRLAKKVKANKPKARLIKKSDIAA